MYSRRLVVGLLLPAISAAGSPYEIFALDRSGKPFFLPLTSPSGWSSSSSSWTPVSSFPGTALQIVSAVGRNGVELFALDSSYRVYHSAQDSSAPVSWTAWSPLGSPDDRSVRNLAVNTRVDGYVSVFGITIDDGSVIHISQSATGWEPTFTSLGGTLIKEIAVVTNSFQGQQVIAIDSEYYVQHKYQTSLGSQWTDWEGLGSNSKTTSDGTSGPPQVKMISANTNRAGVVCVVAVAYDSPMNGISLMMRTPTQDAAWSSMVGKNIQKIGVIADTSDAFIAFHIADGSGSGTIYYQHQSNSSDVFTQNWFNVASDSEGSFTTFSVSTNPGTGTLELVCVRPDGGVVYSTQQGDYQWSKYSAIQSANVMDAFLTSTGSVVSPMELLSSTAAVEMTPIDAVGTSSVMRIDTPTASAQLTAQLTAAPPDSAAETLPSNTDSVAETLPSNIISQLKSAVTATHTVIPGSSAGDPKVNGVGNMGNPIAPIGISPRVSSFLKTQSQPHPSSTIISGSDGTGSSSSSSSPSAAVIAGAVVAVIALLSIVGILVFLWIRRGSKREEKPAIISEFPMTPDPATFQQIAQAPNIQYPPLIEPQSVESSPQEQFNAGHEAPLSKESKLFLTAAFAEPTPTNLQDSETVDSKNALPPYDKPLTEFHAEQAKAAYELSNAYIQAE